jgi:hypothetical protein
MNTNDIETRTIDFSNTPAASDMVDRIYKLRERGWHLVEFSGPVATLARPTSNPHPERIMRREAA